MFGDGSLIIIPHTSGKVRIAAYGWRPVSNGAQDYGTCGDSRDGLICGVVDCLDITFDVLINLPVHSINHERLLCSSLTNTRAHQRLDICEIVEPLGLIWIWKRHACRIRKDIPNSGESTVRLPIHHTQQPAH